jgi:gamma-butyrobetaine dioxygenase
VMMCRSEPGDTTMTAFDALEHDDATRRVRIVWADGHVSVFPYIWLRHGLYFPACGRPEQSPDADCLLIEPPDVPVLRAARHERDEIVLEWSHDDSVTRHRLAALRAACLCEEARRARQRSPRPWANAAAARFPWFEHAELAQPERRLKLMLHVRDHGIALLRGVPVEPGAVQEVARRFGPVRVTHFGTVFDVRSKPEDRIGTGEQVGATQSNAQAPHNDEGYRQNVPGISFFHCLKPDPGGRGASVYIDGFAAAERLRARDPAAFELLSSTPLLFTATRNPHERFRARGRVIATDDAGVVRGIRMADRTLPPLDLPVDLVEPAYRAIAAFQREVYDHTHAYERVLEPGECAIFDNHRILHTRRGFDASAGERWLQQVSVDRDEFHSALQCLALALGRVDEAEVEQDNGVLTQVTTRPSTRTSA